MKSNLEEILRKREGQSLTTATKNCLDFSDKPTSPSPKKPSLCPALHLRPSETPLGLYETVRELAIQWSLTEGPQTVGAMLRHYGDLLRKTDEEEPSLFLQVLQEMMSEQPEQNDSHRKDNT